MEHERIYSQLRADVLSRHFALGKFWRANLFTNVNILGEFGDCFLPRRGQITTRHWFTAPCLPRHNWEPNYKTPSKEYEPINELPELERWRVWNHDRTNALAMTGMRLIQLSVEHRLGQPLARKLVGIILDTTAALFKYPEDSDFGGYILRWDPVADDDWELEIDEKGKVRPTLPGRFLINSDIKNHTQQRYLYCTPLQDPRYTNAVNEAIARGDIGGGQDRFRRWEPSKDEYVGLLAGFRAVFDTFSQSDDPEDVNIVTAVKNQTRRIAKYLQRFGYLLVRPCGGVTARGCGEVLPLFEFAFNLVFQRILGEGYFSAMSYTDALRAAGITPAQLRGTTGLSARQAEIEALQSARDSLTKLGVLESPEATSFLESLDARQRQQVAELWASRKMIDAADVAMQGEVLLGYFFNLAPRPVRRLMFDSWFAKGGTEVADGMKTFLALMVLDDDAVVRKNYLAWYKGSFQGAGRQELGKDGYDWNFASAVGLLVAHKENDNTYYQNFADIVQTQLGEMATELLQLNQNSTHRITLLSVAGAGASPLKHEEMEDNDGVTCGEGPRWKLACEFHDKVGNWFGYMPTLALVWRHLLDDVPNPFSGSSGLVLPTREAVSAWPQPYVPAAVISEARDLPQHMLVPIGAISRSEPRPDGSHDVQLFADPPPRANDNEVGSIPAPKGELRNFDLRGGLTSRPIQLEYAYPPLGEPSPEADFWSAAPSISFQEKTLVEEPWNFRLEDGTLHVDAVLRAATVQWARRFGIPFPRITFARAVGTVSLAWVRQR